MSLLGTRVRQFKDYLGIKRDEAAVSGKLVSSYKERNKKDVEYDEFKRSLIYNIDNLFNEGKTKIIIQPKNDKLHLYEYLIKDTDFNRYYKCDVSDGNSLSIQMKEI